MPKDTFIPSIYYILSGLRTAVPIHICIYRNVLSVDYASAVWLSTTTTKAKIPKVLTQ